jgi:hypothetical protein
MLPDPKDILKKIEEHVDKAKEESVSSLPKVEVYQNEAQDKTEQGKEAEQGTIRYRNP